MSIGVMLFNPFNGKPRHPDDIKSDPEGRLVWDGEKPLRAACRGEACSNLADHEFPPCRTCPKS